MVRVQLPESRLKRSRRKRRTALIIVWLVGSLFLVGVAAGLAHLPHWRIVAVDVVGVDGTTAQAVKLAVYEQLKGNYGLVLPHNNIFVYPREAIEAALLHEFPTFAEVQVRAKNLRALRVEVSTRAPVALWCGVARSTGSPCFVVDERGVVYEPAPQFGGGTYTAYFGEAADAPLPRQYLTEDMFKALMALVAALEAEQQGTVVSVAVDKVGDVSLLFSSGFELKFALRDGGGDVFERFVLATNAEPFEGRQLSDFEYLDLRFGDRLYYKLKGE